MALSDFVSVSISATSNTPTRAGFGVPLIACYHTHSPGQRVTEFSSPTEMVDAGWAVTEPGYKAVAEAFAQSPRPPKVKVGRRALVATSTFTLKVLDATEGAIYYVTVGTSDITYTVAASATTTTVATALAALIDALSTVAATSSTDTITVTQSAPGAPVRIRNWSVNLSFKETTADPGIATDLAAIAAEDNDWYGLGVDSTGKAEIVAAAAWAEANRKLFGYDTCDNDAKNSGITTDVGSTLKASSYTYTFGIYQGTHSTSKKGYAGDTQAFASFGLMAGRFTDAPGSDTWKFKRIASAPTIQLSTGDRSALLAKKINVYEVVAGSSVVSEGFSASGDYLDNRRFIDWLEEEIKVRTFAIFTANRKVPFTDAGVDMVRNELSACLDDGVKVGGLVKGSPVITAPLVANVSVIDKAARHLPDVTFTAQLAGAIHSVTIIGTLSI